MFDAMREFEDYRRSDEDGAARAIRRLTSDDIANCAYISRRTRGTHARRYFAVFADDTFCSVRQIIKMGEAGRELLRECPEIVFESLYSMIASYEPRAVRA